MSETKEQKFDRLTFENTLWILFILTAFFNIIGDEKQKAFLKTNNTKYNNDSKKIFVMVLVITVFIYFYFIQRNYKFYQDAKKTNTDVILNKSRLLGSILLLIGVLLILYYEVNESSPIGSVAI